MTCVHLLGDKDSPADGRGGSMLFPSCSDNNRICAMVMTWFITSGWSSHVIPLKRGANIPVKIEESHDGGMTIPGSM